MKLYRKLLCHGTLDKCFPWSVFIEVNCTKQAAEQLSKLITLETWDLVYLLSGAVKWADNTHEKPYRQWQDLASVDGC